MDMAFGYHLNLRRAIFALSNEKKDWDVACGEWEFLVDVRSESNSCVCGHHIETDYWILNKLNGEETNVGCDCVRQFMRSNVELVRDVKNIKAIRAKKECPRCGVLTTLSGGWHKKCKKLHEADEEKKAVEAARYQRYEKICDRIWMKGLNSNQRQFITGTVRACIMSGKTLTPRQQWWLNEITEKHPDWNYST